MTKFAVLVGCNYIGKEHIEPLEGSHNDVERMRKLITTRLGFHDRNIQVLTDEHGSNEATNTKIKNALHGMVKTAKAGDVLFFYFAGHGGYEDITVGPDCMREEYIVAADCCYLYSQDFQYICHDIPQGAKFTILSDSCHSGGLIFTAKEQIGPAIPPYVCLPHNNPGGNIRRIPDSSLIRHFESWTGIYGADIRTYMLKMFKNEASLKFHGAKAAQQHSIDGGILISACRPNEGSKIVMDAGNIGGAFTNAVVNCLTSRATDTHPVTNRELVETATNIINDPEQNPCLYCADENVDAAFLG